MDLNELLKDGRRHENEVVAFGGGIEKGRSQLVTMELMKARKKMKSDRHLLFYSPEGLDRFKEKE